jgi:hypothetical protein
MAETYPSETRTKPDRPVATIDVLPDEVLLEVLSYIWKTHWKTFLNLSLTSRRLNVISEPFLYHTYRYSYRINNLSRNFILSLVNRPQLASHLKNIVLEDWAIRTYPLSRWTGLSGPRSQVSLLSAAEQFQFPAQLTDKWKDELKDDLDDAKIALLFLLTPNVEKMNLVVPPCYNPKNCEKQDLWLLRLLHSAVNNDKVTHLHGFTALRSLQLTGTSTRDGFCLRQFAPLFCSPSLRTFSATNCLEMGSMSNWNEIQNTSHIESITFNGSQLSMDAIKCVLGACKAVKSFDFEWECINLQAEEAPLLDYAILDEALQLHMRSLESLKIRFTESWRGEMWAVDTGVNSCLHSLGKFPNLRMVDVASNALLELDASTQAASQGDLSHLSNLLPPSLEKLVLNYWESIPPPEYNPRFEHLRYLAAECSLLLPKLKSLEIHTHGEKEQGWEDLAIQFGNNGVKFSVTGRVYRRQMAG